MVSKLKGDTANKSMNMVEIFLKSPNVQRTLISQTMVTGQELFFAVSYSKPALVARLTTHFGLFPVFMTTLHFSHVSQGHHASEGFSDE